MGLKKVGEIGKWQTQRAYYTEGDSPSIQTPTGGGHIPLSALGVMTMTSTPAKSTESTGTMEHSMKETSEQLMLIPSQNKTYSVRDFLARASALLESGEDSAILEAHYSLKYAECYGLKDLECYSLRTSKDCSPMTEAKPFNAYLNRWMNWGMTVNGKCLTARTSESRRIEKECSLSGILEAKPDAKYFLSAKQAEYIHKQVLSQSGTISQADIGGAD